MADEGDAVPSLSSLVGFQIVDVKANQAVGRIADIDDQTANILFELEDGRLIPANDDLITDIDMSKQQITMTIPDGLLDLRD